jgi:hypothetical protein
MKCTLLNVNVSTTAVISCTMMSEDDIITAKDAVVAYF